MVLELVKKGVGGTEMVMWQSATVALKIIGTTGLFNIFRAPGEVGWWSTLFRTAVPEC